MNSAASETSPSSSRTATEPWDPSLAARLDRIEAKLDQVLGEPPPDTLTLREAMKMVGCNTPTSFYRWTRKNKIHPFDKNKYRRVQISNAMAHASLFPAR